MTVPSLRARAIAESLPAETLDILWGIYRSPRWSWETGTVCGPEIETDYTHTRGYSSLPCDTDAILQAAARLANADSWGLMRARNGRYVAWARQRLEKPVQQEGPNAMEAALTLLAAMPTHLRKEREEQDLKRMLGRD